MGDELSLADVLEKNAVLHNSTTGSSDGSMEVGLFMIAGAREVMGAWDGIQVPSIRELEIRADGDLAARFAAVNLVEQGGF